MDRKELENHYRENRNEIRERLEEFKDLREAPEKRLFRELVFVILSSQTSSEKAWEAAKKLEEQGLLLDGSKEEIERQLESSGITYPEEKASYIVENRRMFSQPTLKNSSKELKVSERIRPEELDGTREWLVENVKGLGWKGASHFLRNIGHGNSFAIISTHIVQQMKEAGLIEEEKPPNGKDEYLEMERRLQKFSEDVGIGVKELDLVLWSMKTGKVFR